MITLNKEKVFFLTSCIISIFFLNVYTKKPHNFPSLIKKKKNERKTFQTEVLKRKVFPKDFHNYIIKKSRQPFQKLKDKKKLSFVELPLPFPKSNSQIFLAPIPGPSPKYYGQISLKSKQDIILDVIPQMTIEKSLPYKKIIMGTEAQIITSKVRHYDMIIMKDYKKFRGKIIHETQEKIIVSIIEKNSSKNVHLPKHRISQVKKALSSEKVCQTYFEKYKTKPEKLIKLAKAAYQMDKLSLSENIYSYILKNYPLYSKGYIAYAHFALQTLNVEKAYTIYQQALKYYNDQRKEDNIWEITLSLAILYEKLGLYEKAFTLILPIKNKDFSCVRKVMELSFLLKKWNIFHKTLEETQDTLEQNKLQVILYWKLRYYLYEGKLKKGQELIEENPEYKDSKLSNIIGIFYYLNGNLQKAQKTLINAAKNGNVRSWYNLALVYFQANATKKAIDILETILHTPETIHYKSKLLSTLAYIKYANDKKSFSLAKSLVKKAILSHPEKSYSYYILGALFNEEEQDENSFQNYEKALQRNFDFNVAMINLGIISNKMNNIADSIRYIKQSLTAPITRNRRISLQLWLARSYIENNQISKAQKLIHDVLETSPVNVVALKFMGWIANRENQAQEAIEYFKKVLKIQEKDLYAQKAIEDISYNRKLVAWEDAFSRPNNNKIRRRWQEIENDGIDISLRNHRVYFSGKTIEGNIPTFLLRSSQKKYFISLSAQFGGIYSKYAYFGLFIGNPEEESLYFGKDNNNKLAYMVTKNGTIKKWKRIDSHAWDLGKEQILTIKIQQIKKKKYYLLFFNKKMIGKIQLKNMHFRKFKVGFFGYSNKESDWEFYVDNVRIIELDREK